MATGLWSSLMRPSGESTRIFEILSLSNMYPPTSYSVAHAGSNAGIRTVAKVPIP